MLKLAQSHTLRRFLVAYMSLLSAYTLGLDSSSSDEHINASMWFLLEQSMRLRPLSCEYA